MTLLENDTLESAKARQIVDAAKEAFMELGFEGASTDEIVRRAAISKGTLYNYFPTKQHLFEVMLRQECGKQSQRILANIDYDKPFDQVLTHIARSFIRLLLTPFIQDLFRLAVAEARRFPDLARTFYQSGPQTGNKRMTAILEEFGRRGAIDVPDPQLAAYHFEQLCKADLFYKSVFGIQTEFTDAELNRITDAAVSAFLKIYGKGGA